VLSPSHALVLHHFPHNNSENNSFGFVALLSVHFGKTSNSRVSHLLLHKSWAIRNVQATQALENFIQNENLKGEEILLNSFFLSHRLLRYPVLFL